MPDRDITEKHLEAYNDVFADIVNVLLFDGQRRVCPAVWGVRGGDGEGHDGLLILDSH